MPSDVANSPALRSVTVRRRGEVLDQDLIVVEEPLEIRLDGKPLVVTMRTPGDDEELAAGFLHAEGVIAGGAAIASLRTVPGEPETSANRGSARIRVTTFAGDRVDVALADDASGTATGSGTATSAREFRATAACGVCGKESMEDLDQELPSIAPVECRPALFEELPDRLRAAQTLFEATGGIHAAGIFSLDGDPLCVREDIGRHNAVDKVIGHFVLRSEVPLRDRILVVSGRAGFELVQKALKAAIPAMVSVGAASSVAVDMAAAAGMTLYSFAGRGRGNLHVA
ncbi:MAG: formate dehydrogenase accessory sulfurtransferase FdhD [Acidobacteriota bacterium]|nr:formate dehydrogenase accessory sulfurtransferase FdhD [Acidobacteriota bacterium]